jgi:hypothetical protein
MYVHIGREKSGREKSGREKSGEKQVVKKWGKRAVKSGKKVGAGKKQIE